MPALKERPKLDKNSAYCRELACVSDKQDDEKILVNRIVKDMLVFPDVPYNYIMLGTELRRSGFPSATTYNVRKVFRHLAKHGVVEELPAGMYKLTPEFKELLLEVLIQNAKNRPKRKHV